MHRRNSRRVYVTILALQGLFIKVGQLLSIMANFLPEEFRAELEALQDKVPPRPYAEIADRLHRELGDASLSPHRRARLLPSVWRRSTRADRERVARPGARGAH